MSSSKETPVLDKSIIKALDLHAQKISSTLETDVISYYGPIFDDSIKLYRDYIEGLTDGCDRTECVSIFLTTNGGLVEVVEKLVDITRYHYKNVQFFVPDSAMSAGTIWCLSGNRIYMDYSSSLGPVDPQVMILDNGRHQFVPALGYLDQVERLIQKSADGTLTDAEFVLLQNQDLAKLRRYEQARDLSVELIKKWLLEYKFANWLVHRGEGPNKGCPVTHEEKVERAEAIAKDLGDNKVWHSHSRMIGMKALKEQLRLEIEDFRDMVELREEVRVYSDVMSDYASRQGYPIFLHGSAKNGSGL